MNLNFPKILVWPKLSRTLELRKLGNKRFWYNLWHRSVPDWSEYLEWQCLGRGECYGPNIYEHQAGHRESWGAKTLLHFFFILQLISCFILPQLWRWRRYCLITNKLFASLNKNFHYATLPRQLLTEKKHKTSSFHKDVDYVLHVC